MLNIWQARKWATITFYWVQQSTFSISVAAWNIFWVFINADEIALLLVIIIFSHQVAMILLGPSRRTVIPCRHHQQRTTWFDKADNTWRLVIMKISFERVPTVLMDFIFGSVHVCWVLIAIAVPVILGIVWKAKIIYSTTLVSVMISTRYT